MPTPGALTLNARVKTAYNSKGIDRARRGITSVGSTTEGLTRRLGGLFLAYQAFGELTEFVSSIQNADNLLRTATDSTTEMLGVKQKLLDIAHNTRTSFFNLADGYKRYSTAADAVGLSNKKTLEFTEQLSKVMVASGRSTQEVAAAQTQLGQALGKGKLDGDEFRSLMENMTPLMHLFAKELGVSFGELKSLAPQGKITAEVMFGAILNQTELINKKFGDVEVTVGQAFAQMSAAGVGFFSMLERRSGILGGIASTISWMATKMKEVNATLSSGLYGEDVGGEFAASLKEIAELRAAANADPEDVGIQNDLNAAILKHNSIIKSIDYDELSDSIASVNDDIRELTAGIDLREGNEQLMKQIEAGTTLGKEQGAILQDLINQREAKEGELSLLLKVMYADRIKITKDAEAEIVVVDEDAAEKRRAAASAGLSKLEKIMLDGEKKRAEMIMNARQAAAEDNRNFEIETLEWEGRVREAAQLKILDASHKQMMALIALKREGHDVSVEMDELRARTDAQIERTQNLAEVDPAVALRNVFGYSADDLSNFTSRMQEAQEFAQFGQHEDDPQEKFEAEMAAEEERHVVYMEMLERWFQDENELRMRKEEAEMLHAQRKQEISDDYTDAEMRGNLAKVKGFSFVMSQIGGLADQFAKKSSTAARLAFFAHKAAAIANAIVSAHEGAANALAQLPPPINIPFSKLVLGLGYASAAAIAATSLGGGGGSASRSSAGAGSVSTAPTHNPSIPIPPPPDQVNRPILNLIFPDKETAYTAEDFRKVLEAGQDGYGSADIVTITGRA